MSAELRREARRALLLGAIVTATFAAAGPGAGGGAGATAGPDTPRILLVSNRDGTARAYSVEPDGSGPTPLLPPGPKLDPVALSPNGSTIAYSAHSDVFVPAALYVSRADGTGLRRLARNGWDATFSPDGRLLAFAGKSGIWAVRADGGRLRRLTRGDDEAFAWAPSSKAIVAIRVLNAESDRYGVVVQPLRGKPRVLVRTGPNDDSDPSDYDPQWSPDGRWISYVNGENKVRLNGLTLIRPNGKNRHRIVLGWGEDDEYYWAPNSRWLAVQDGVELDYIRPNGDWHKLADKFAGSLAWSPDGKRLAYSVFEPDNDLVVARGDGSAPKRLDLPLTVYPYQELAWAPDSSRLAFSGNTGRDPLEVWLTNADGTGLRRVTNDGMSDPLGWTRLAPTLPPAQPLPPTERVLDGTTVAASTPVVALAADGSRVAFAPKAATTDCEHVEVWTPGGGLTRLGALPAPCGFGSPAGEVRALALAGSRAAWISFGGRYDEGACSFTLLSATLAGPSPLAAGGDDEAEGPVCDSPDIDHLRGDGDLLVFNNEPSHAASLVRLGSGAERCGELACATLRKDGQGAPVASVSQGLIVVSHAGSVTVLDAQGALVRRFAFAPADVNDAVLDGRVLVVWRFGVLDGYDVDTGARVLSQPFPPGYRLEDVDGGVALLRQDTTLMLLRLDDGRSSTLSPGRGPVLADLEPAGLYYSFVSPDGT